MSAAYICETCGTQFAPSNSAPEHCPICEDARQYVGQNGQRWTTLPELRRTHDNAVREEEPNLHSIESQPSFGIGQQAYLLQTPEGNVLWDCIALIDEETVDRVRALGGVRAIAISHPHYYTTMVEWSRTFENAPIHLHELDRDWVMRSDPSVQFWTGERLSLFGGVRLVRTGGHFDGFQVAHWAQGAEGKGVLLAGDQPQVCADPRWVSFMYSYPNYIPLGPKTVAEVVRILEPLEFDRLYGPFRGRVVKTDAKSVVRRSAQRFLEAISPG